jgi:hypothetical protein
VDIERMNLPETLASLKRPYPSCLCDEDILDAHASNGEVLIGGSNSVRHLDDCFVDVDEDECYKIFLVIKRSLLVEDRRCE